MKPYAITGLGVVSPFGAGYPAFEAGLSRAQAQPDALFRREATVLDPNKIDQPLAAECVDFDAKQYLGDKGLRNFDRLTKFMIVAAKLALQDAGLKVGSEHRLPPDRIGLCSATAYGSLEAITEAVAVTELEDPRFLNPNRFPNTVINAAAGYVSIWEDLRAPNVTVVDGNCGALDAVLSSETHLLNGRADAFLVGGGEALSEPLYTAFRKLRLVADGQRRFAPGQSDSQGMRLGEGAAYLCVEGSSFAAQRGARVRAQVVGYGNAFEPPESEALLVHASPVAVERTIHMALRDAGLRPQDIDLVVGAHSGIASFDVAESRGIDAVFQRAVPIAVPKAIFGETFGAGGALAMACVVAWFAGAPVAPLLRGELADPPKHALVLALGYYGNVSAVVMRRPQVSP